MAERTDENAFSVRTGIACVQICFATLTSRSYGSANPGESEAIQSMLADRPRNLDAAGGGPCKRLVHVQQRWGSPEDRAMWLEQARVDAILDSSRLSMKPVRSGVKCFMAFAGASMPCAKCLVVGLCRFVLCVCSRSATWW